MNSLLVFTNSTYHAMNLSLPKVGRRSTILLTTLVAIVGVFAYYFLVHVETNESQFIDRSYRVLDRKVKNIQSNYEGKGKYLEYVFKAVQPVLKVALKAESGTKIAELYQEVNSLYDQLSDEDYYYKEDREADSLMARDNAIYNKIEAIYSRIGELENGNQSKVSSILESTLREAAPETVGIQSYTNDFQGIYYNNYDVEGEFHWSFSPSDSTHIVFREKANDFLKPLLKNGLFQEYILIKKGQSTENEYLDYYGEDEEEYSIIYQSVDNLIDLESISPILQGKDLNLKVQERASLDSIFLKRGPKTVKPLDVSFFNHSYKLVFHRFKLNKEEYYLGGFIENSTFKKESQKVEAFFLILAILVVLLLLIAMPILKLVFMSPIERLHISNVIMAGGSLVLGVPIVLLITFNIHVYLVEGSDDLNKQLVELSDSIEDQFKSEITTILDVLHDADSKVQKGWDQLSSIDTTTYPEFNHIFWVDKRGNVQKNKQRTLLDRGLNSISVAKRAYYMNVVKDKMWRYRRDPREINQRMFIETLSQWMEVKTDSVRVPEKGDKMNLVDNTKQRFKKIKEPLSEPFFLESIVSWSDFTNEAAISIPSKVSGYPAAVLTTQLHSVMNPILPKGFGFAIIDENGLVQFHSDKNLILQENFLEETNKYSDLQSGKFSRVAVDANIKYHNINHKAYMQPINAMPLYLVTFYNMEYRNAEIQGVVSISMILLFGSFAVVALMILVLHLIQKKKSKLKIKIFLFNWIKPDEEKFESYQFLLFIFLLIGLINLVFIGIGLVSDHEILFSFIVTNAYLFLIAYSWLTPKDSIQYTERPTARRNFYIAFILVIVVADMAYLPFSNGFPWWALYQGLLLLLYWYGERLKEYVFSWRSKAKWLSELDLMIRNHAYNIFLFSWLLISSVLPIFYIFMVAHNEENVIWEKFNQIDIANQYHNKLTSLADRMKAIKGDEEIQKSYFDAKLNGGIYILKSEISNKPIEKKSECATGISLSDKVLANIRPHYNKLIVDSKGLAFDISQERNRQWCFPGSGDKSSMHLSFRDNFIPSSYLEYQDIYVQSQNDLILFGKKAIQSNINNSESSITGSNRSFMRYILPNKYFILFVIAIILILIAVYKVIEFCTNKIYGIQYSNFKNTLPLTVANFKKISIGDDSITHNKQRQIFLLGLPKSNKGNLLKSLEENLFKVDMIHMNQVKKWESVLDVDLTKYDGVIIENFEYGVSSHSANVKRLHLIEELLVHEVQHLFISSNVHPSFITEFYESKLINDKDADQNMKEEYLLALETWRHMLGGFILVHNPIKENTKINDFLSKDWITNDTYKELFNKELNRGSFLPNLLPGLKDYFVKLKNNEDGMEEKIDKEDLILRIQMLAESYYMGLWNTLSKEERYIIYDLAKDRFVNINNQNGIRNLLEKGLLVYDNELRIMNESFTNFVLSIIKKEEALMMEKEVRDKGTWSTISAVLGMAVLGIIAFLFLGNPDFFHDFNALISALIAVIGILPRVGGLLSFGKRNSDVPV